MSRPNLRPGMRCTLSVLIPLQFEMQFVILEVLRSSEHVIISDRPDYSFLIEEKYVIPISINPSPCNKKK